MPPTRQFSISFFMRCAFLSIIAAAAAGSNHQNYRNIYGNSLEKCSETGMALTGYTRDGSCIEESDDTGSHHICINLNSTTGGNFCEVTGQENWCSSTDMPCHEDASDTTCSIQNWCVCQWAFASYMEKAGGCDDIQEIRCEAINLQALRAYQTTSGYETALECLVQRCGIDPYATGTGTKRFFFFGSMSPGSSVLIMVVATLILVVMVVMTRHKKSHVGKSIALLGGSHSNNDDATSAKEVVTKSGIIFS